VIVALRTARTWRLHPRSPEDVSDEEVRRASGLARPCRRCESKILASESRCPRCGSISHEFSFAARGIDVWMPFAFLGTALALILVLVALL
jgi:hypothetical protein